MKSDVLPDARPGRAPGRLTIWYLVRNAPALLKIWLRHCKRCRLPTVVLTSLVLYLAAPSISTRIGGSGPINQDYFIRLLSALGATGGKAAPVTVVDIDEASFRAWDRPAAVPRQKLVSLIAAVAAKKPAVVAVDVDVASDVLDPDGDLQRFVAAYPQSQAPYLLLVRSLQRRQTRGDRAEAVMHAPSRLDPLVTENPRVAWVSAYIRPDDASVFRSWPPVQFVCADRTRTAYGALGLMVAATQSDQFEATKSALAQAAESWCLTPPGRIKISERTLPEGVPIFYSFNWRPDHASTKLLSLAGDGIPPFVRLSAQDVISAGDGLSRDSFAGRIVLIGGSYEASNDFHRTPLGEMPGLYILANAAAGANSALKPQTWSKITAAVGSVLALAFLISVSVWLKRGPALTLTAALVCASTIALAMFNTEMTTIVRLFEGALVLTALYTSLDGLVAAFIAPREADDRAPGILHFVFKEKFLSRRWPLGNSKNRGSR